MASIKDAFEESFQDNHSFFKFFVLALPVYYCTNAYLNKENLVPLFWVFTLTFLLLFGFVIKCTTNVRNGANNVLPGLNIFDLIWTGTKGTVALGPVIVINCILAHYLCKFTANFIVDEGTLNVFKFVIWSIFGAIIMTGYLGYAKTFKIKDAYNFKAISQSSTDVLIAVLFMIPQVLLAAGLVLVPASYILWLFFGMSHSIAIFYYCIVFVFTLAVSAHYLAQIDFEVIPRDDKEMF